MNIRNREVRRRGLTDLAEEINANECVSDSNWDQVFVRASHRDRTLVYDMFAMLCDCIKYAKVIRALSRCRVSPRCLVF